MTFLAVLHPEPGAERRVEGPPANLRSAIAAFAAAKPRETPNPLTDAEVRGRAVALLSPDELPLLPSGPSKISPPPVIDLKASVPVQRDVMPRPNIVDFFVNTAVVLARPVHPEPTDAFILVPAIIGTAAMLYVDVPVHRTIRAWPDPDVQGERWSYWASYLGEGWVDMALIGLIGVVGGAKGERTCIAGLTALTATAIASRGLKLLIRLERPSYDPERHHVNSPRWQADAMPSGHTMSAFATAAVIAEEYPQLAPLAYGLAAYVGIARIQQSTHWGSDVIAGAALGLLFGWEAVKVTRKFQFAPFTTDAGGAGLSVSGATF